MLLAHLADIGWSIQKQKLKYACLTLSYGVVCENRQDRGYRKQNINTNVPCNLVICLTLNVFRGIICDEINKHGKENKNEIFCFICVTLQQRPHTHARTHAHELEPAKKRWHFAVIKTTSTSGWWVWSGLCMAAKCISQYICDLWNERKANNAL